MSSEMALRHLYPFHVMPGHYYRPSVRGAAKDQAREEDPLVQLPSGGFARLSTLKHDAYGFLIDPNLQRVTPAPTPAVRERQRPAAASTPAARPAARSAPTPPAPPPFVPLSFRQAVDMMRVKPDAWAALDYVAVHEAGHAIVARVLKIPIDFAALLIDQGPGYVHLAGGYVATSSHPPRKLNGRAGAWPAAFSLAGDEATKLMRYNPLSPPTGPRIVYDAEAARRAPTVVAVARETATVLASMPQDQELAAQDRTPPALARQHARMILETNRAAIRPLARALVESKHGLVSADEVARIMRNPGRRF